MFVFIRCDLFTYLMRTIPYIEQLNKFAYKELQDRQFFIYILHLECPGIIHFELKQSFFFFFVKRKDMASCSVTHIKNPDRMAGDCHCFQPLNLCFIVHLSHSRNITHSEKQQELLNIWKALWHINLLASYLSITFTI